MKQLKIKEILNLEPAEQTLNVKGWIRTSREAKNFCFLEVNDGSIIKNLQVFVDKGNPELEALVPELTTGTSVEINGLLVQSPGGKQNVELQADKIIIIGKSPVEEYPLQKKQHSFEFLREISHLRPRTNTFGAVARVRNALSYAIHCFFQERGFIYLHTPIITASDCEGAGEMFQVTTLPLDKIPKKDNQINYAEDFFGKKTMLTVSGQLEAEIYACALGDVYTFGPTFRAEHSNTSRHLAEFWMVEPEMAFCDIYKNMDIAEEFLKYIIDYIMGNCAADIDFFNKRIDQNLIKNLEAIINTDFIRISYTRAIKELEKAKAGFEYAVKWGIDLQSEHERYLTEKVYKRPVIIIDYPKEIKAFYMKINQDDKTVRAMDILFPRLGEIIGGSQREDNPEILKNRIGQMGLNPDDYWWYLELRTFGSVPHAGFGLGLERFVQFVTGMQNIRDVIPFPRAYRWLNL